MPAVAGSGNPAMFPTVRFRRVRPGLYERIDTPRHVEISGRLLDAIRAENPLLANLLEAAEHDAERARPWWRRIW